jgi:hypothetical protein
MREHLGERLSQAVGRGYENGMALGVRRLVAEGQRELG